MNRAEEMAAKLEAVRMWLDQSDLDAVLLSSQPGFAWITAGGHSHVSLGEEAGAASVLVTRTEAYALAANIETRRLLDEELGGLPLKTAEWAWHDSYGEGAIVDQLVDPARTVSDLGRLGLPVTPPDFTELRFTLLPSEKERYRRLGQDAAHAVEVACQAAQPGDTELDIAARVAFECARRNIVSLVNLVGADGRIARYRHPLPTGHRLQATLLVALTGRRHGLHASLTRMVRFGPPDPDLAARHEAVSRVDARLIMESRPGEPLGEVLQRGLDQYGREGFSDEWRFHHQGGITGYSGREVFGVPGTQHTLGAGYAIAWNPSITRVKSEDTVLISDDGHEVVTRTDTWPQEAVIVNGGAVERPALVYG